MGKIKTVCFILILCMIACFSIGCAQKENLEESETQSEADKKEDKVQTKEEDTKEAEPQADDNTLVEGSFKLYYVDQKDGNLKTKQMKLDDLDPSYIWEALKTEGVLSSDCTMLSFDDSKRMEGYLEMDVDQNFGNQLRSNGTTGEEQFMACIVNTYLDAYDCKGMKITEEENVLESGHVSYDGYISKMMDK